MVTKIKPRRMKSDNPGSLGDFLGYQDESKFSWGQGGSGQGNVKAFYLSDTSDLTTAQAAYDRYDNGKEPIIVYGGETYIFSGTSASSIIFSSITTAINGNTEGLIERREVEIKKTGGVYSISTAYFTSNFLDTNIDYILPYTPQYNGSPTTKKYVDDKDTYIGSSAPSNPVEGRLRYDTANDQLKVYDGTNRNNVNTQVTVEDNLTSTSITNALSANQGRILDGKIADLMALGKFLSLWNATTGQPISFPYTTPYAYSTGDYFLVETVSSATPPVNYRPTGSSYTGTASSTVETDEVEVGDVYIYDGSVWLLQSNHGKTVSFANIAGQPTDNLNLAADLNAKQDVLTAGDNIDITSNVISADDMRGEISNFSSTYGMTHWDEAKKGDIAKVTTTVPKIITAYGQATLENGVDGGLTSLILHGYSANVSPLPSGYTQLNKVTGTNATIQTGLSGALATVTFSGDKGAFKLRQDNELVFNAIPCKNSSNTVGFYDLVSETFKTTDVALTAGDVVEGPTPEVPRQIQTNNGILSYNKSTSSFEVSGPTETLKISYLG